MRQVLFLAAVACLFCSSYRAGSQTTDQDNYKLTFASNVLLQPEFIDGLVMDAHCRKTTIKNIVEVKKNSISAAPETGVPEKKFTVINNQVVLVNNDHVEMVDSNHQALKNAEPLTIAEPAKEDTKDQIITEAPATEVVVTAERAQPAEEEVIEPVITKYAEMISVDPTEITNYPLYHFIDKWYGVRYRWGGDDNKGIDCSAFSRKLYSDVYRLDIFRTAREQHRTAERIRHTDDANEGDLIFFRIHHLRISHVGVYLANGYFVHASRSKGVVISNINTRYWQSRYAGCGRIAREDKPTESDYLQ
jgi:cell wall-associated NlpC family hydrolase